VTVASPLGIAIAALAADHLLGGGMTDVLATLLEKQRNASVAALAQRADVASPVVPGELGPVALAGWSLGVTPVAQIIEQTGDFPEKVVREVYAFGPSRPRMIERQVYNRHDPTTWQERSGGAIRLYLDALPAARKVTVDGPKYTRIELGDEVWSKAHQSAGFPGGITAHSANVAFLLTDALRRSKIF
jgi:hypothetical protein